MGNARICVVGGAGGGVINFVWGKPVGPVLNLLEDSVVVPLLGSREKINEFQLSCTDALGLYLPF